MSGWAVVSAEAVECRAWVFGVLQSGLVTLTVLQKPYYSVDTRTDLVTIFGEGIGFRMKSLACLVSLAALAALPALAQEQEVLRPATATKAIAVPQVTLQTGLEQLDWDPVRRDRKSVV